MREKETRKRVGETEQTSRRELEKKVKQKRKEDAETNKRIERSS